MSVQTYISTDWKEIGGIGFHTFVKAVLTDQNEAYLISVSNVDGQKETAFWKMKGKFYFNNEQELLASLLDSWPEAEKLSVREAFMMKMLTYEELKEVETRILDD